MFDQFRSLSLSSPLHGYLCVGLRQTYDQARGEDHSSLPWPAQTVLDVGVPFYLLLATYDSQLLENSSVGIDTTMRWVMVVSVIICRYSFSSNHSLSLCCQIILKHSLKWLVCTSELLELWVNAALASYDNPPLVGTSGSASTEVSFFFFTYHISYLLPCTIFTCCTSCTFMIVTISCLERSTLDCLGGFTTTSQLSKILFETILYHLQRNDSQRLRTLFGMNFANLVIYNFI